MILIGTGASQAQEPGSSFAGSSVRVHSSAHPGAVLEGRLTDWSLDSVVLAPVWRPVRSAGSRMAFATKDVIRIDVERARTRNEGMNAGFKRGVLGGLISAVGVAYLMHELGAESVFGIAALTFATSAAANAVTGYASPGKTWETVHPDPLKATH
jgi:hypothetical protein